MFFRVVILVFAATCCTARVIDVSDKQSAWERSGKFEGDIVLTDEQMRNGIMNPASRNQNDEVPFVTEDVFNVGDKQSAWEQSGKFEGDIMLTEEQRNGLINTAYRWPNKVVPFVIDDVFTDDQRHHIMMAIDEYHKKTPIRLREYDSLTDKDYIHITGENSGCWSYVGRQGGHQQLNLQPNTPGSGCFRLGTIEHELLHALGFYHQQSATERDDFVTINWKNIQPGTENNFKKYNVSTITSFGVLYDYDSVMHYGPTAFSINGLPTIVPKDVNATIGQRDGFSEKDILKLQKMYENSSYATRSQFITLIIITLNVLTQLQ